MNALAVAILLASQLSDGVGVLFAPGGGGGTTFVGGTVTTPIVFNTGVAADMSMDEDSFTCDSGSTCTYTFDNVGAGEMSLVLDDVSVDDLIVRSGIVSSPDTVDLQHYAVGTGATNDFRSGDSIIRWLDGSDGTTERGRLAWSESAAVSYLQSGTGAVGFFASGSPYLGVTTNVAANAGSGCFGDTLTGVNAGTATFCAYGAGFYASSQTDAQTCADNATGASPGTLTVSPASSYVSITVADPDGCTLTMGETSAVSRVVVDVVHAGFSGSGAGVITAAAVAGVYDNGGVACVLNDGGVLGLTYSIANVYSQRYCAAN